MADLQQFYGHGKLLLSGEYFVLDGAQALAIPTKFGQNLRVKNLQSSEGIIFWVAKNFQQKIWLNLVFDKTTGRCLSDNSPEAETLSKIIIAAKKLNPTFLDSPNDIAVETNLEFPNEWGLGSSSTLIYCVSQWANIDGVTLLNQTMQGSGYDVACAGADSPILYERNKTPKLYEEIDFNPSFASQIYFVYTGQKQLSSKGILHYKETVQDKEKHIDALNLITQKMRGSKDLQTFEAAMQTHENLISKALQLPKIKDLFFKDFEGEVKSLGAWGGDFVMMTWSGKKEDLIKYLHEKKLSVVFNWNEMIYKK